LPGFFVQTLKKGYAMKTTFATAGLLLGAMLLPVAAYSADKAPSASPSSANETAPASDAKDRPVRQGRRSSQPIDDSVITTKVKASLAKDKLMSALKIEVKTIDGVVELGGEANSKQEAAKAASIARKVKGVKSVKNMISVAGAPAGTMADKDRPARSTAADSDRPAKKMGRSDQPVDDTVITTKVTVLAGYRPHDGTGLPLGRVRSGPTGLLEVLHGVGSITPRAARAPRGAERDDRPRP
jgi:hyperosmotically inducible protein